MTVHEAGSAERVSRGRELRSPSDGAIVLDGLRKVYGDVVAVDHIDLTVPEGSIYALVGPNGAGKTTTIECMLGLRRPTSGRVSVLGRDPAAERQAVFQSVGAQLQEGALPERLTVAELLQLFVSMYDRPAAVDELLEALALGSKRRAQYGDLSGGQKHRLHIALAFAGSPRCVVLDEPTSGLDPQARHNIWSLLHDRRAAGTTVLVTTHHLDEAEDHCDEVVVIDRGRAIAKGAPKALLAERGLGVRVGLSVEAVRGEALSTRPEITHWENVRDRIFLYGRDAAVYDVARDLARSAADGPVEMRAARLEDLFLLLTGREYREG